MLYGYQGFRVEGPFCKLFSLLQILPVSGILNVKKGGLTVAGVYTVPQIRERLMPVFTRNGIKRAVLFGSYGKGTASDKSDVDLLVDSGLRGLRFVGFLGEVQDALEKEVDLFDVSHIEPGSLIDQEIQETGVTVYEK